MKPPPEAPRTASLEDLDQISETLASAFADYAWTNWAVPEQKRRQRVRALQRLYAEHLGIPHGLVLRTENFEAVAVFVRSGTPRLPEAFWDQVAALHGEHFSRVMTAEELLQPVRPPHAWVLAAVGVRPEQQGRGFGTRVVRAGLAHLDSEHADCLVETSSADNVRLYRRLGWRPCATVDTGGPTVWVLHRPAATPASGGSTRIDAE